MLRVFPGIVLFCGLFSTYAALGQESAGSPTAAASVTGDAVLHDGDGRLLAVYSARALPAGDLADVVRKLIGDSNDLLIVAEPHHNSLVIHGPREAVEVLLNLLQDLDKAPTIVELNMWVVGIPCDQAAAVSEQLKDGMTTAEAGVRLLQAQNDGIVKILDHVAVSTLDNQMASVQVGQTVPVATGEQATARGKTRSYTFTNVGLVAKFMPRVTDGKVTLELNYERSELGRTPDAAAEGQEIPPTGNATRQAAITTVISDGTVAWLGGGPLEAEGCAQWRILVSVQTRQ